MRESNSARASEVAALRLGIELGMSLSDSSELHGDGGTEEIVAKAIYGQHKEVFVVMRIYTHDASCVAKSYANAISKRLRTEAHVRNNVASLKPKLTKEDLTNLDLEFPPAKSKRPLPVL